MLAEADSPKLHPAFDMTYDWTSQCNFYMIVRGTWSAGSLDQMLDKERLTFPEGAVRMRHLTNHDMQYLQYAWDNRAHLDSSEYSFLERTDLAKKYGPGDRAFAVLCATLPNSKPLVWNGQELGIFSHTPKLQWKGSPYLDFYRKLLHAYRENPALYEGDFHRITTAKPASVYAYRRRTASNQAVVIVNLGNQPQHITLGVNEVAGKFSEVFTGESKDLTAAELDLRPWGYKLFVRSTSGKNE